MLSKVSTTLGLSSASMAASESELSISSSSKSASSGAASPPSPSSPLARSGAPLNGGRTRGRRRPRRRLRQDGGAGNGRRAARGHDRPAVEAYPRRRHGLGVGPGIGRFEVDDVAQEHLSLVELVAPNDDGLEGERALTQTGDHRFAASLDALGDGDLALARQQLH